MCMLVLVTVTCASMHIDINVQATYTLASLKRRHHLSNSTFKGLLACIRVMLPDAEKLPSSWYKFRQVLRGPMQKQVDARLQVLHMCSDPECDHIFSTYPGTADDSCPVAECTGQRFRCAVLCDLQLQADSCLASPQWIWFTMGSTCQRHTYLILQARLCTRI